MSIEHAPWSPAPEMVARCDGVRSHIFLALLEGLRGVYDGGARGAVDQYEHSLQCASRAARDGVDDELVAVALLHDCFRVLAPAAHGEALALAIGDRLSRDRAAVLYNHSAWQHDAVHGTACAAKFATLRWYPDACRLGAWDAASFDPGYESLPVGMFIPGLRRLLDS